LTPERWAQVEELFHRAAECDSKQRSALLETACNGDQELRREVESLLASEDKASDDMQAAVECGLGVVVFPLVGETVSHYRILDGIGGGGMGLVYAAEDLKLGRKVALKFLPEESAKDAATLERFEREARSASALEHPNICPIYEFGEHEGQPFLVMQLLEGRTLRELIAVAASGKPPFLIEELLHLAIQIADGLGAAHQKGIIHRDIKPANIFVTSKGQAKILDFGLAKLSSFVKGTKDSLAPELGDGGDGDGFAPKTAPSQTPDLLLSQTGVAMGTAGYMSPEQARGEKLDARTDLFSFGLVLYEMATGQHAFKGDTGPMLRKAILNDSVPSPSQLNSKLPARLGEIIVKALEKDRHARYQSAAQIRDDLQGLKEAVEHRFRWTGIAAGGLVLLFLIIAFLWLYERRQPQPRAQHEPKLTQLTVNSFENRVTDGSISPDGKYVAYADSNGLRAQALESSKTYVIPQPEELKGKQTVWEVPKAAWFPDSPRFLANAHPVGGSPSVEDASIWVVSALDKPPVRLRDNAVGYSVSPDGSQICFGTNRGRLGDRDIWLMNPEGENPRKFLSTDEKQLLSDAEWSPDGQRIYYLRTNDSGSYLESQSLGGGHPSTILSASELKGHIDYIWLPDGRLLSAVAEPSSIFGERCNFWTRRIDPKTGEPIEPAQRLTDWPTACMASLSVTADGKRLAFVKWEGHLISYLADIAAGGSQIRNLRHFPQSESSEGITDWTPDSKTVIITSDRSGGYELFKQRLDVDIPEGPLVLPPSLTRDARVTPDGKWLVYFEIVKSENFPVQRLEPVMRVPISGGQSHELFISAAGSIITCGSSTAAGCVIAEPSPDRQQLIVSVLDPMKGRGPELTRFASDLSEDVWEDRWFFDMTTDGSRYAFIRTPTSPIQIFSRNGSPMKQLRVKGWNEILKVTWAPDGKGFYVTAQARSAHEVLYVDLQGNAHPLWESPGASGETFSKASPDGRYLVLQSWTTRGNIWLMDKF
jgi:serine/threonine protein kinase